MLSISLALFFDFILFEFTRFYLIWTKKDAMWGYVKYLSALIVIVNKGKKKCLGHYIAILCTPRQYKQQNAK